MKESDVSKRRDRRAVLKILRKLLSMLDSVVKLFTDDKQ